MSTAKTDVVERIFEKLWHAATNELSRSIVTLTDVQEAIREHNQAHASAKLSDKNPANFFKDFIRNRQRANANWPESLKKRGFTARQLTGENACFEFICLPHGQSEPFPNKIRDPSEEDAVYKIESASLPLASRRLGRKDEPWLVQVLVRLRVIETHLSVHSLRRNRIVQVDHRQMSVKQRKTEIDALFLVVEQKEGGTTEEIILCCEAKGRRDDILEDQALQQAKTVFKLAGVTQDIVIPIVAKAFAPSKIYIVEFAPLRREDAEKTDALTVASKAVYELLPPVPGIGK